MTRRRNLPLLLFAVFTLFLGSCVPLTPAPSAYPNPSSLTQSTTTSSPMPVQATPTIGVVMDLSMPTASVLWVTVSPEQLKKNEAILEIARLLLEKARKTYLTPGWMHYEGKTENFQSMSSTMPDGSPIPMEWRDESWTLVDEHGQAIQTISLQDTGDVKTSQVTTFQNGVWKNLTYGMVSEEEKSYSIPMDSGFLKDAETDKDILELEYSIDTISKEQVAVFTVSGPTHVSQSKPGRVAKFYFSLETGTLLKIEDYRLSSEGQLQLFTLITTRVLEKVEQPPAEVLKYLTYAPVTPVPNENNYESEYCQIPSVQLSISDAKGLSDDEIAGKLIELLLAYFNAPQAPDWCRIDGYTIDKVYYDERTPSLPLEPKGDIMRVVRFSIKLVQIPNFWMSWAGDIDQQYWLHTGKNVAVFRSTTGYTMKFANP